MEKTTYLKLNLTDTENISFGTWRKSIDGNNPEGSKSNMQKIDEAFGEVIEYLLANGGGGGSGIIETTDEATLNDKRPITSHGVAVVVGNVEALLKTI